jgi:hypothetical protein
MANYNKKISETAIRVGEVRFSYCNVFAPRKKEDGTDDKYSVQLLIPKTDTAAKKLLDGAIEAAKQAGVASKWNGKLPPASKLKLPLRDGDEEFPEDANYEGMWFLNCSTPVTNKPGVRVLEDGQLMEALDDDDFYSGCWGCAAINFFAYNTSGNQGVAAGLNNLVKTRDDKRLGGSRSAEQDFADLTLD